jgi:transposase
MWTDTTRKQFARSHLRLPSDLTDAEWAVLEPLLPRRSHRGRPPLWSYREIVEAMLYLLRGGLPWRMLPPGLFPPMTTVQHYFYLWRDAGLWPSINHILLMGLREATGREATFAWLGRNRRLAKDFERAIESATAWLYLASIQLMTRRTASLGNYTE